MLLYSLELVGLCSPLDVAIVQVRAVSLFRLSLQVSLPPAYTKIFTVKGVGSKTLSVHSGKHYPSDRCFTSCCDAVSEDGFSGGPILNSRGRVLGMFKGTLGTVDRLFVTSEGLVRALNFIQKDWTFKDWGIKSVISEDQEEHAPRDADPPKDHEAQHFRKRTAPRA